jgi:hypothetical protein
VGDLDEFAAGLVEQWLGFGQRLYLVYRTREGRLPFDEWLRVLRDQNSAARVLARIGRFRRGNLGD